MMGFRTQLLVAFALWPYGSWLTLYYLRQSVADKRKAVKVPRWIQYTSVVPLLLFGFSMVTAFATRPLEASVWVFAAVGVFIATKWWATRARSGVLREWSRGIPLSFAQRKACDELWKCMREGRVPKPDPLSFLNEQDRKYLLRFCSIEYRPELFGRNPASFRQKARELEDKGYTEDQAHVLAGMVFNMVGRTGKREPMGR